MSLDTTKLESVLEKGEGVLRLLPTWVPRTFCIPGRRMKLHPDDYYGFGAHRGGIVERWFSSTVKADNGPPTLEDEGLSYIALDDGPKQDKILLKDAIGLLGDRILGKEVMEKHGEWTMFAKFFDNMEPLPHHLHQNDESAARVGRKGKPEGYYFPRQLNNHAAYFPYTFFGLNQGTRKQDVKRCLENWDKGDNGILYLSYAYKLKLGTGWNVPAGVLHAPGTYLTYEPQRASDVFAMFQSLVWEKPLGWDMVVKDVPEEYKHDLDYIADLIDWDLNLDPNFYANRFLEPKPVKPVAEMKDQGYEDYWVVYNSEYFGSKELTVHPGREVRIKDSDAYGLIMMEGHGKLGPMTIESPSVIRFGQATRDELFVTVNAAKEGVVIKNESEVENLVMLKHFGPEA
ncbi:MAG TPA: hypothetical protein VMZ05_09990 [Spirochaetota bacterium]|nr:hypothetical protein [Spirochaetota bacterium]